MKVEQLLERGGGTLIMVQLAGDGQSVDISTPLTVRDFFAGLALVGLIAQSDKQMSVLRLAEESYKCADAMLEKRGNE